MSIIFAQKPGKIVNWVDTMITFADPHIVYNDFTEMVDPVTFKKLRAGEGEGEGEGMVRNAPRSLSYAP